MLMRPVHVRPDSSSMQEYQTTAWGESPRMVSEVKESASRAVDRSERFNVRATVSPIRPWSLAHANRVPSSVRQRYRS